VENLEKAFGDLDFVFALFGETVMPDKTPASRHKNIRIVQQERASQKIIERWQLPQSGGAVSLDQGVKKFVGCEFSFIERE